MSRILVFIDHDIVIRHFLLNDTFRRLEERHDVAYVIATNPRRVKTDPRTLALPSQPITLHVDEARLTLYRKLYRATVMRRVHASPAYASTRDVWRAILGRAETWKCRLLGLPLVYPLYRTAMLRAIGTSQALVDILERERPSLVIHPTVLEGLFVSDLIAVARERSVPSVYIMNSWDNPSTKALMVGCPDWLVVWGRQTEEHAVEFLGMPRDRIRCLGAAQFEAYRQSPSPSPEEFRRSLGLSEDQRLILYAGSSTGLDEIPQIRLLEEGIRTGQLPRCHVLFRPHPWRGSRRAEPDFHQCGFQHVSMDPALDGPYRTSRESDRPAIHMADYAQANVVLRASAMVVSGFSSMMLEAALLGRGVVCSVFDEHIRTDPFLGRVSTMVHFREFLERMGVERSRRAEDLVPACRRVLERGQDPGFGTKLGRDAAYFVSPFDLPYPERLAGFVDEILQGRARPEPRDHA
jgi:hypothetical protein